MERPAKKLFRVGDKFIAVVGRSSGIEFVTVSRFIILAFPGRVSNLINLLLLVDAELARAAVDQEEKTADNGQDLEEVVLGKVLVRMVLVELAYHFFH